MFSATWNNSEVILSDGEHTAVIWPSCGGILNAWQVRVGSYAWNAIEGYDSVDDFIKNGEAKGFRSMKLSPFVCRMRDGHFSWQDAGYTVQKFFLGPDGIHGLVYDAVYDVLSCEANDHEAWVLLSHVYTGTDAGYPFQYQLRVRYALQQGQQISVTTVVHNLSDSSIPVADGWHPYFSLNDDLSNLQLQMSASQMLEFDDRLLPTGRLLHDHRFIRPVSLEDIVLDNCFVLDSPGSGVSCRLIHPQRGYLLEITADKLYPYLQVYTPPQRQSIAIENLSAAPDAFNNGIGLTTLHPGDSMQTTTTYCIRAAE